nr:hypothetical protein [Maliibacterium massiliense]
MINASVSMLFWWLLVLAIGAGLSVGEYFLAKRDPFYIGLILPILGAVSVIIGGLVTFLFWLVPTAVVFIVVRLRQSDRHNQQDELKKMDIDDIG